MDAADPERRGPAWRRCASSLLANTISRTSDRGTRASALPRRGRSGKMTHAAPRLAIGRGETPTHEIGVVVFPGTWSDCDFHYVISEAIKQPVKSCGIGIADLTDLDCLVLPGGFSYGDYLRAGAVAGRSPVVEALPEFSRGRPRARLLQRLPDPLRGRAPARAP